MTPDFSRTLFRIVYRIITIYRCVEIKFLPTFQTSHLQKWNTRGAKYGGFFFVYLFLNRFYSSKMFCSRFYSARYRRRRMQYTLVWCYKLVSSAILKGLIKKKKYPDYHYTTALVDR